MDPINWLEDLAAAYRIELSEVTVRRYLKSLDRWLLTREQWEHLSDRAVLRYSVFPTIHELYRIVCELKLQTETGGNSQLIAKKREDWEGQHNPGGAA